VKTCFGMDIQLRRSRKIIFLLDFGLQMGREMSFWNTGSSVRNPVTSGIYYYSVIYKTNHKLWDKYVSRYRTFHVTKTNQSTPLDSNETRRIHTVSDVSFIWRVSSPQFLHIRKISQINSEAWEQWRAPENIIFLSRRRFRFGSSQLGKISARSPRPRKLFMALKKLSLIHRRIFWQIQKDRCVREG
jgi:hypothetical protein